MLPEEYLMNIAIIFAGGTGSRMNSKETPKQFLTLCNKPIIIHTIEYFEKHPLIDAIVVACIQNWMDYFKTLVSRYNLKKVKRVVPGGATGQLSIYHGLKAANELDPSGKSIVLIHDGVRPLINERVITDNIDSVLTTGSAITTGKVTETILVVNPNDSSIEQVPQRDQSRMAKAPQSFWLKDILSVHEKALEEGRTNYIDSCTMMQQYGFQLHLIDGPIENIKITTPCDYYIARAIIEAKENNLIYEIGEKTI